MFEQIADYTELLFPGGILKAESVLGMMAKLNDPEDNNWAYIQVIGWLYQYYISEKHDEVVDINGSSINKEDIPKLQVVTSKLPVVIPKLLVDMVQILIKLKVTQINLCLQQQCLPFISLELLIHTY